MDIVLDASVAVKWFNSRDEDYVDAALLIQERKLKDEIGIIVPDLFFLEVLNAFITKSRFTTEDILTIKESLIKMSLKVIHPDSSIFEESINIANANKLTIYDSLYIAAADLSDVNLYTEDKEILSCVKEYPFIKHIRNFGKS